MFVIVYDKSWVADDNTQTGQQVGNGGHPELRQPAPTSSHTHGCLEWKNVFIEVNGAAWYVWDVAT